ncbi:hypothetical protein Ahy_A02g005846 isoform B [Arachis hypogaea]|uniref:Uncharacterized protein n=1 Tax=Arachis hypogaea TaxID=3818 RepID=A0A445E823_ARAHY|nr:hypothetical protein Ahy_A02g005846 isoform B [Arachis hypogaea]
MKMKELESGSQCFSLPISHCLAPMKLCQDPCYQQQEDPHALALQLDISFLLDLPLELLFLLSPIYSTDLCGPFKCIEASLTLINCHHHLHLHPPLFPTTTTPTFFNNFGSSSTRFLHHTNSIHTLFASFFVMPIPGSFCCVQMLDARRKLRIRVMLLPCVLTIMLHAKMAQG